MSEESPLFESSLRDQQRQGSSPARNKRIAGMKQKQLSVSETLASGQEGRLYNERRRRG